MESEAQGARFTLLGLGRFRQSASFSYNFQDNVSDSGENRNSSTQHGFSEAYALGFQYSILHPRLLNGDADVSFIADQELADDSDEGRSSSGNNRISYRIKGTVLNRKPNPLIFNLSSSLVTVRPPFGSTYTVDTKAESVSWSIRNRILPISLLVNSIDSTTSGLVARNNESRTVQIGAEHRQFQPSDTQLALTMTTNRQSFLELGSTDDSKEGRLHLSNTLTWHDERGLNRRLDTKYLLTDRRGVNYSEQKNLVSNLNWDIGKALDAAASVNLNRTDGLNGRNDIDRFGATVNQQYLRALRSHVGGMSSRGRYSDGSDVILGWNAGVRYMKTLPNQSDMSLNYEYSEVVQDRERSVFVLTAFSSLAVTAPFPQDEDLFQENIDPATIRVFLDEGRTLPFTDYTVLFSGVSTRLRINSDPGVPQLYLSYSYRQSPDVKFQVVAQSVGSQFAFLNGRHLLNANYSWTESAVLEGNDSSSTLDDTSFLNVKLQSNLTPHQFTLEYMRQKAQYQDLQAVEASWTHSISGRGASLRTEVRDRCSWFDTSGASGISGWDNTLLLTTTYRRSLIGDFKGRLSLSYYNLTTSSTTSHRISSNVSLDGSYGRTVVSLEGAYGVGFGSSSSSQSESLTLNLRRMF